MKVRLVLVLALLGVGAASCLRVTWNRELRYAPVADDELARLAPGDTSLEDCLSAFGAPLWVWEHVEAGQPSAVLAYGWFHERDVGLRVSVPIYRALSASFDYDQIDQRMRGLVLFFDADWKLSTWRTGLLRDLTRELRRPPAALEELEAPSGS